MSISLQVQYQQILDFFYQQISLKGLNDPSEINRWIDEWISQLSPIDQLMLFEIISGMNNHHHQDHGHGQIEKHLIERSGHQISLASQSSSQSQQGSLRSALFQLIITSEQKEKVKDQVRSQWPYLPRFQIKAYLGEGQTAKVYLALDQAVNPARLCALKVGVLVDPMRFEREITLMKQVSHPNVMPCFDAAQFEDQGIQKFWISMPNLVGLNLEDLILQDVLDLNTKISALIKVLDGLCALHEKGIIHRDLKPGNCLVSAEGEILLSDFGLSAHQDSNANAQLTQTLPFHLIGTPAFMSPEQAKSQRDLISFQSDVWAFGIMIYEMLVGDLPWGRSINYFEMLGNIQHLPIPMEKFNALGFPKMKIVIDQCLNREIKQRFPHAMALKKAFVQASQEDLQVIFQRRRESTCAVLKAKKVFEGYFKSCLLEGKALRILDIVQIICGIDRKKDWDWAEISRRFTLGEQWVQGWYSWKDDYLKKIAEMQGRLEIVERNKVEAMKALMDLFKEKMNQVPSDE
jgi:hypothetical protein